MFDETWLWRLDKQKVPYVGQAYLEILSKLACKIFFKKSKSWCHWKAYCIFFHMLQKISTFSKVDIRYLLLWLVTYAKGLSSSIPTLCPYRTCRTEHCMMTWVFGVWCFMDYRIERWILGLFSPSCTLCPIRYLIIYCFIKKESQFNLLDIIWFIIERTWVENALRN